MSRVISEKRASGGSTKRETKLRHAAALALVGWYLMTPSGNADLNLVSSKWKSLGSFDSADDCETAKADSLKIVKAKADANPKDTQAQIALGLGLVSQCVATDDPRLKEK